MDSEAGYGNTNNSFLGGYSGRILFLISLCSVTSTVGWLVIPPLLPLIIEDLSITAGQAGIALSVLTGLSAVARFPAGRLADQFSRKTILAFSLLVWIIGFSILTFSATFWGFLTGVMFVGLGLGAFVPSSFAQLSDLFMERQGRAFGINNAAFNLGGILASGLAILVLSQGMWRIAFLPVLVMLIVLTVQLHKWIQQSYVVTKPSLDVRQTVGRLALESRVRVLLLVAAIFSFTWNGSITFLPTFLESEQGLSATLGSIAFASVFIAGVVATPTSGAIGDKVGSIKTILGALIFAFVGLVAILSFSTPIAIVGSVIIFAIGLTGFWPVMTSYMMNVFPDDSKGGDYGAISTVYMGAGSLGPAFVGMVGEVYRFSIAYATLGFCLLSCFVLVCWLYIK